VHHSTAWDKVGAFVTGMADLPVIGPILQKGAAAATAAAVAPFTDDTFGEVYRDTLSKERAVQDDNPGYALAGNVAGTAMVLRGLAANPTGAKWLGLTGSLPARAGHSAVSGGGLSAADTAARGGDLADTITSGALGAGIGGAIPLAGELASMAYQSGKNAVSSIWRGAFDPDVAASRNVARALEADRLSNPQSILEANDIAAAQRNGQPLINADLGGERTRALARAAANQSPEARGAIERTVNDRFADQGGRIVRMVNRLTGGKTDDLLAVDGLKDMAAAQNRSAYSGAFSQPTARALWNEGYEQLMQAPAMQQAARDATARGANRAAAEGFQPVRNPFVDVGGRLTLRLNPDGSTAKPTLQFWDQVKKGLDDQIGVAQRSGERSHASDLLVLKNHLVSMLDDAVPQYRTARQGAAAFFGAQDALEAGKMFARSSRMLPEFQRGIAAMKPAERELFETGFASEMIDAAKNARDRVNVVQRIFGSPEQREKMAIAFGPQKAREVEAFVRIENAMDLMRGALGNSTTMRQFVEAGLVGTGTWWWTGDYKTGIGAGMAALGARRALAYGSKKIDERVLKSTADILLSSDPKLIEKLVRNASVSPAHMAAIDAVTKAIGIAARSGNLTVSGAR